MITKIIRSAVITCLLLKCLFAFIYILGNGEPAVEAIPTALYVFLQCLKPLTEIPYEVRF